MTEVEPVAVPPSKPLPPLPAVPPLPPLPPPPSRSSSLGERREPVLISSERAPPANLPTTPLPPLPSVKAAVPAAMCETPAFAPPSPDQGGMPATPPVSAKHEFEEAREREWGQGGKEEDKAGMQAQMERLRAEIAALQRDIDTTAGAAR